MNKETIVKLVKDVLATGKVTVAAFAKQAKTSPAIINKLVAGEPIKEEQYAKIESALNTYYIPAGPSEGEAKKVADPYMAAVNSIINDESFSLAVKNILDVKEVLKVQDISGQAATACANIINRELAEISKAVTRATLNI